MHTFILILHVLGAGLMLGVVFFAFVFLFQRRLDATQLAMVRKIYTFGTIGAIWQVVTGSILYMQEADEFQNNKLFWLKMALFVLDGVVAVMVVERRLKAAKPTEDGAFDLGNVVPWSLVSVLFVVTIIALGVLMIEGA